MLEIICNVGLKPSIFSNKDDNYSNIFDKTYLSESFCDQFKEILLKKKIEFINIATEEKKKDDKNIICTNFVINNFLSFFNTKDKYLNISKSNNTQNKNIQKKKLEKNKNFLPDDFYFLKNIKYQKIKKNSKKNHTLDVKLSASQLKKNKNLCNKKNEFNHNDIKDNYTLTKFNHHDYHKKINFYKTNQDNIKTLIKQKELIFFKDSKNDKNSVFLSKNINKIDNVLRNENFLKDINQKKTVKLNIKPLFLSNSDNSIEWKKLVNQKILLSISNKDNYAEIYLKPENLGSIYIKIHMKENEASLNFISNQNEVRTFLDNYMPSLQDSLKKNGIRLSKVNIFNSVQNSKIKDTQNVFYLEQLKKRFNTNKKNTENLSCEFVDLYI